jgi:hypothetical protein
MQRRVFEVSPRLVENLTNSLCQVVGVTVTNQQATLRNVFPRDEQRTGLWRESFTWMRDGGPGHWQVVFIPGKGESVGLRLDLAF